MGGAGGVGDEAAHLLLGEPRCAPGKGGAGIAGEHFHAGEIDGPGRQARRVPVSSAHPKAQVARLAARWVARTPRPGGGDAALPDMDEPFKKYRW